MQEEFPDQGSSRIALVQSMMNAVPCLAGPIASITTTRFGYRRTAMLGGTITSVSLLATSFARRLQVLYITHGNILCIWEFFSACSNCRCCNRALRSKTIICIWCNNKWYVEYILRKRICFSLCKGGAFGQCVFAIVLQKLIDKYEWNGAMMLFSGIVLSIVAFAALFREVEWDEEDYDEEEGNYKII